MFCSVKDKFLNSDCVYPIFFLALLDAKTFSSKKVLVLIDPACNGPLNTLPTACIAGGPPTPLSILLAPEVIKSFFFLSFIFVSE